MYNAKVKCLSKDGIWFKKNKIYNVENGFLLDEEGTSFSMNPYKNIEDINSNSDYFFEEIEKAQPLPLPAKLCVEKCYLLEYFQWGQNESPPWFTSAMLDGKIILTVDNVAVPMLVFAGNKSSASLGDYVIRKSDTFFVGCNSEKFNQYYNVV